jgi:hypothetical protein
MYLLISSRRKSNGGGGDGAVLSLRGRVGNEIVSAVGRGLAFSTGCDWLADSLAEKTAGCHRPFQALPPGIVC